MKVEFQPLGTTEHVIYFLNIFLSGVASTNLKIYPDLFVSRDGGLGWSRVRHLKAQSVHHHIHFTVWFC